MQNRATLDCCPQRWPSLPRPSALATGAAAQPYPDHVVQIIVPTSAGSSADILGRVLADGFSSRLGRAVIVVDKAGAAGGARQSPMSPAPNRTATR